MLYDGATIPFATDFIEAALQEYAVPLLSSVLSNDCGRRFAGEIGGALIHAAADWSRKGKPKLFERERIARFSFGEAGIDLLQDGWSYAEHWGTWSCKPMAIMMLPRESGKNIRLSFRAFGKQGSCSTVSVSTGEHHLATWQVRTNEMITKELLVPSNVNQLEFHIPNALSPTAIGLNDDSRALGIGLVSLEWTA
jgi:hypothetical protein